jgi:predicted SnoaL-like aldol condensation-catalyzing enzyme
MPRGRTAIPITQLINHPNTPPGVEHAKDNTRTEQGDRSRSLWHLFNKRDYAAAERFWSSKYIQHSAHIAPGREGLFALVRLSPNTLRYENQLIVAEGDYVIAHGRFTGIGRPAAWIAADVVRFEDGVLQEHWDVLQDEATKTESVSGLPMFGDTFPEWEPKASQSSWTRPRPFLTEQGDTSYDFTRCCKWHVCNFGRKREYRLDHRQLSVTEGQEGARRGARRWATTGFVDKGAEAFTADLSDVAALKSAFSGAHAAYVMLPPAKSRED